MVKLVRADISDAQKLYDMQVRSFAPLLEKYQDFDTNPGAEKIDRTIARLSQSNSDFYFIYDGDDAIGAARVVRRDGVHSFQQLFILPQYQGRGLAQAAMVAVENMYPDARVWKLDTILQEEKLCYLYEKMGYKKTGRTENIKQGMDIVFFEK